LLKRTEGSTNVRARLRCQRQPHWRRSSSTRTGSALRAQLDRVCGDSVSFRRLRRLLGTTCVSLGCPRLHSRSACGAGVIAPGIQTVASRPRGRSARRRPEHLLFPTPPTIPVFHREITGGLRTESGLTGRGEAVRADEPTSRAPVPPLVSRHAPARLWRRSDGSMMGTCELGVHGPARRQRTAAGAQGAERQLLVRARLVAGREAHRVRARHPYEASPHLDDEAQRQGTAADHSRAQAGRRPRLGVPMKQESRIAVCPLETLA
jgi:hypothetical protein